MLSSSSPANPALDVDDLLMDISTKISVFEPSSLGQLPKRPRSQAIMHDEIIITRYFLKVRREISDHKVS